MQARAYYENILSHEGDMILEELCKDIAATDRRCAKVRDTVEERIKAGAAPFFLYHGSQYDLENVKPMQACGAKKEEGVHSILDLGCGLGRHSLFFAKNGFKVTAMNLSADAIAETKKLGKQSGIDYLCRVSDMVNMPFSTDAFDAVFSYHVISHQDTEGVKKVIKEISRVLKPNGKVFMTLCSKTHEAFLNDNYPRLDENTVLKTEGAEMNVPHFFADKKIIKELFQDYEQVSVRHITECEFASDKTERSHYFIEAVIKKEPYRLDYSGVIGRMVSCIMDRPMGMDCNTIR